MGTTASEVFTPEQVADLLRIGRDDVYRRIEHGELPASGVDGEYRILRQDVIALLLVTEPPPDIVLHDHGAEQIAEFLRLDELDDAQREVIRRSEDGVARQR